MPSWRPVRRVAELGSLGLTLVDRHDFTRIGCVDVGGCLVWGKNGANAMQSLKILLVSLIFLPASAAAKEPEGPKLKVVETTKEIKPQLDLIKALVGKDFPTIFLPEDPKTLKEAFALITDKKRKARTDRVLKDADTVFAVELTVGEGDGKRTVFVFAPSAEFRRMVYVYSSEEKEKDRGWRGSFLTKESPRHDKRMKLTGAAILVSRDTTSL